MATKSFEESMYFNFIKWLLPIFDTINNNPISVVLMNQSNTISDSSTIVRSSTQKLTKQAL